MAARHAEEAALAELGSQADELVVVGLATGGPAPANGIEILQRRSALGAERAEDEFLVSHWQARAPQGPAGRHFGAMSETVDQERVWVTSTQLEAALGPEEALRLRLRFQEEEARMAVDPTQPALPAPQARSRHPRKRQPQVLSAQGGQRSGSAGPGDAAPPQPANAPGLVPRAGGQGAAEGEGQHNDQHQVAMQWLRDAGSKALATPDFMRSYVWPPPVRPRQQGAGPGPGPGTAGPSGQGVDNIREGGRAAKRQAVGPRRPGTGPFWVSPICINGAPNLYMTRVQNPQAMAAAKRRAKAQKPSMLNLAQGAGRLRHSGAQGQARPAPPPPPPPATQQQPGPSAPPQGLSLSPGGRYRPPTFDNPSPHVIERGTRGSPLRVVNTGAVQTLQASPASPGQAAVPPAALVATSHASGSPRTSQSGRVSSGPSDLDARPAVGALTEEQPDVPAEPPPVDEAQPSANHSPALAAVEGAGSVQQAPQVGAGQEAAPPAAAPVPQAAGDPVVGPTKSIVARLSGAASALLGGVGLLRSAPQAGRRTRQSGSTGASSKPPASGQAQPDGSGGAPAAQAANGASSDATTAAAAVASDLAPADRHTPGAAAPPPPPEVPSSAVRALSPAPASRRDPRTRPTLSRFAPLPVATHSRQAAPQAPPSAAQDAVQAVPGPAEMPMVVAEQAGPVVSQPSPSRPAVPGEAAAIPPATHPSPACVPGTQVQGSGDDTQPPPSQVQQVVIVIGSSEEQVPSMVPATLLPPESQPGLSAGEPHTGSQQQGSGNTSQSQEQQEGGQASDAGKRKRGRPRKGEKQAPPGPAAAVEPPSVSEGGGPHAQAPAASGPKRRSQRVAAAAAAGTRPTSSAATSGTQTAGSEQGAAAHHPSVPGESSQQVVPDEEGQPDVPAARQELRTRSGLDLSRSLGFRTPTDLLAILLPSLREPLGAQWIPHVPASTTSLPSPEEAEQLLMGSTGRHAAAEAAGEPAQGPDQVHEDAELTQVQQHDEPSLNYYHAAPETQAAFYTQAPY